MSVLNLSCEVSSTSEESENHIVINRDEFNSEYTVNIWQHLLQKEKEKPQIHLQSPQLAHRGALVQNLRDIVKKLDMSIATLHRAVAHLDLFMDAHVLRSDRIMLVTLACLSLAAKSEVKANETLTVNVLSSASGVQLCRETLRRLELMIGLHLQWKLRASTAFTFASILAKYIVQDSDLISHNPVFVKHLKGDGIKLLNAYLDLTLSESRFTAVGAANLGCACVACTRADLGLCAWPTWLANITTCSHGVVASVAKPLRKIMLEKNKKKAQVQVEVDQGYTCALLTPYATRNVSSNIQISSASSTCISRPCEHPPCNYEFAEHQFNRSGHVIPPAAHISEAQEDSVLDMDDSNVPTSSNTAD